MPIESRPESSSQTQTSLRLVDDDNRFLYSREAKSGGKAKLLICRLYKAITNRVGESQRNRKVIGGRDTVKQEYIVDDQSKTWCDVTIPNTISITPDTPSPGPKPSKPLNAIRASGQILDRDDYLTILARFSAADRLAILRRTAKQFSNAYLRGTLRDRPPSVATKQYYTLYHVQIAVELCQYQPENDFFPAPNAYNLEHGIQCLNTCSTLDRFLLYCDATRIEYEMQTGLVEANRYTEGSKALSFNRDNITGTIKELEHFRRHMDRDGPILAK